MMGTGALPTVAVVAVKLFAVNALTPWFALDWVASRKRTASLESGARALCVMSMTKWLPCGWWWLVG